MLNEPKQTSRLSKISTNESWVVNSHINIMH